MKENGLKMSKTQHGHIYSKRREDGMVTLMVSPGSVADLMEELDEMAAMYADDARENWWDADDIARSVAERIHDLLSC